MMAEPKSDFIKSLIALSDRYMAATGEAESTLSKRILNGGKRLAQIRRGSDVNTMRFQTAVQWFSDNWPEGAAWPDGIARPAPGGPGMALAGKALP